MKEQKVQDIIGCPLNTGKFNLDDIKKDVDSGKPNYVFDMRGINTNKFGEYFLKCIGKINSIAKKDLVENGIDLVVKDRIGYRIHGKNFTYAQQHDVFNALNSRHVELVCRKQKKEAVADFWKLKEDFFVRFHNLKTLAHRYIDSEVYLADIRVIGSKMPTQHGGYGYNEIGWVRLNERVARNNEISISIQDDHNIFTRYDRTLVSGGNPSNIRFSFTISISYDKPVGDEGKTRPQNIVIFDISPAWTSGNSAGVRMRTFDTEIVGVRAKEMLIAIMEEVSKFEKEFDARLEQLKEKYKTEFLLNEICFGDSAI